MTRVRMQGQSDIECGCVGVRLRVEVCGGVCCVCGCVCVGGVWVCFLI